MVLVVFVLVISMLMGIVGAFFAILHAIRVKVGEIMNVFNVLII
jgi:hypothetical protein